MMTQWATLANFLLLNKGQFGQGVVGKWQQSGLT